MTTQLAETPAETEQVADLTTPVVMAVPFTEATALAVARRLHDGKCRSQRNGDQCPIRDTHAMLGFGEAATMHLSALAAAHAAGEL